MTASGARARRLLAAATLVATLLSAAALPAATESESSPPEASGAAPAEAQAAGALAADVTPDPPFQAPSGPVSAEVRAAVDRVLAGQARAMRNLDAASYLATFGPPAAAGAVAPGSAGQEVSGSPEVRVREGLFGEVPPGSTADYASVNPLFVNPGPDGSVEVLTRQALAYRGAGGSPALLDIIVLERLAPRDGKYVVFDWTLADEALARLTWPVWLSGRVELEPFDARLDAELTYTLYDGFFGLGDGGGASSSPVTVVFALADTFEVTKVSTPRGDLPWERRPDGDLAVTVPEPGIAQGPVEVTITYGGYVVPAGTRRRGNLDYLGAEAIYLRPDTGWYPRPVREGATGGSLRGSLTVTVPAWWAAAAPGRLTAVTGRGGLGETRTFTWSPDLPAELYLVAGSYLVAQGRTEQGVTVRAFLYAREAAWSSQYVEEAGRILTDFGDRFGQYPYGNLTLAEVQDFYYGGLSARSLVLLEKAWLSNPASDPWTRDLLVHEISHQWWGEIVPIIDDADWFLWEGLASFCEALYAEDREGPGGLTRVMADKTAGYSKATRWHDQWSIAQANVRMADWQDEVVYDKGAWVFESLRFLIGDERFNELLRDYIDKWAGRQPSTADLTELVAAIDPTDSYLQEFVARWVEQPGQPDLSLAHIRGRGTSLSFDLVDRGPTGFPKAEVKVVMAGGASQTVLASAGPNTLELPEGARLLVVDPEEKILDLSRSNNTWYLVLGLAVPAYALSWAADAGVGIVLGLIVLWAMARIRRRRRKLRATQLPVSNG